MLGATLKRLGCCGVLVWLMIGAVFATFFIGEYLERPESEKSIWKAGVTVRIKHVLIKTSEKCCFSGYLVCWHDIWNWSRSYCLHIPYSELCQGQAR